VNYSEIEGSDEFTDRFRLTSVRMEKLLCVVGPFLHWENQPKSRFKWEAVATNSTTLARYRTISFSGWHTQCVWGQCVHSCFHLWHNMV